MPELSSRRRAGADVSRKLPGSTAVGAFNQSQGGLASHAAMACRPDDRHYEIQGRSSAVRPRDRNDRDMGRRRGSPGQPGRPACPPAVRRGGILADRHAGSCHQVPGVCRVSGRPRPVRRIVGGHPDRRGSLHQGDPDPFGDAFVAQGGASRAVLLGRPDRGRNHGGWRPVPG